MLIHSVSENISLDRTCGETSFNDLIINLSYSGAPKDVLLVVKCSTYSMILTYCMASYPSVQFTARNVKLGAATIYDGRPPSNKDATKYATCGGQQQVGP